MTIVRILFIIFSRATSSNRSLRVMQLRSEGESFDETLQWRIARGRSRLEEKLKEFIMAMRIFVLSFNTWSSVPPTAEKRE